MPVSIYFEFKGMNFSPYTDGGVYDKAGNYSGLNNHLRAVSASVVQTDATNKFRTAGYSSAPPRSIVSASEATQAAATVYIDSKGNFYYLNNPGYDTGRGYDAKFGVTIKPTIATAPGTGAVLDLSTNFNLNNSTGEYLWNGNY